MSKIYVVGLGPGNFDQMTPAAFTALEDSDFIVGYKTYIDLIKERFPHKKFVDSGMKHEIDRCRQCLELALNGSRVSIVSSGDSGVYGMAGVILEIVHKSGEDVEVEIIPGITAATAAAAVLGAPLMHDFAVISLSDLLTPWELICKRLEMASTADFVICLYNPRSKGRQENIAVAREIMLKHKKPDTPVGIVKNAGRAGQEYYIATLKNMLDYQIDMFTTVIVGNSMTYLSRNKIITPRGYKFDEH